jgi:hypothetical protein
MSDEIVVDQNANPRNRVIADIAKKVHEANQAELQADKIFGEPQEEPAPEPKEEPAPEPAPDLVTIKVDGQEKQVSRAEIEEAGKRYLQKDLSAERKLTEASRLFEEARLAKENSQPSKPDAVTDDDDLKKLIMDSPFNEDAADKLVARLGRQQAIPDATEVVKRVLAERDLVSHYNSNYPDIAGDPFLHTLFLNEEERMRNQGDNRPHTEVWADAAEKLRKWKGIAKTDVVEDKAKRKETIVNLPAASARVPAPAEPKQLTASQLVEKMRKDRGQRIN